jgi:hypothetical protein
MVCDHMGDMKCCCIPKYGSANKVENFGHWFCPCIAIVCSCMDFHFP